MAITGKRPLEENLFLDIKLNEGSGKPLDYSGNRNHVTDWGTPPDWTTANGEPGLDFVRASLEYGDIANHATLNPVDVVSLMTDFTPEILGTYQDTASKSHTGALPQYELMLDSSGRIYFNVKTDVDELQSPKYTLTNGIRAMALGVYDGSYVRLYVDGVEIGSGTILTGSMSDNGQNFTIGARRSAYGHFDGKLFRVMAWNAGLSKEDAALLYTQRRRI